MPTLLASIRVGDRTLGNKKDLPSIRILYFRTRWIPFHINFAGVRCVRTRYPTALSWDLCRSRIVFGLCWGGGSGCRKGLRRRGFRFGSRWSLLGYRTNPRWCRRRPRTVSVAIPLANGFRSACRLTSHKRHTESNRSRENKVPNHSEYCMSINSFVFE